MAKVFFLNTAGVRSEILNSPETTALIRKLTEEKAAAASQMSGRTYEGFVITGKSRVYGVIRPADMAAYASNLKHNTLLRVLGGGM